MRALFLVGLSLVLAAAPAWSQAQFWLKNSDASALLIFWIVPAGLQEKGPVLGALAVAPGGPHRVAPGQRIQVNLEPNSQFVGVYVPWTAELSLRTTLSGGFIFASEAPTQGTLLVDRPRFAAANRGRALLATLQEWGLIVPRLVLDGRSADWSNVPELVAWGNAFVPASGSWPATWPRFLGLQVVDRDGGLWIRLTFENRAFPGSDTASLLLQRPGATLEWPWNGRDDRVWFWDGAPEPREAGARRLASGVLEAFVPWNLLSEAERRAWLAEPGQWVLAVSGPQGTSVYPLAPFSGDDLP